MTTLFDIIKKSYLSLGHLEISTATSGTVSTVIDTKLGEKYGDDDIAGSSVLVIRDAGGLGSAPEGEVSLISGYISSTNTISLSPNFTVAVGAGDKYGIAKNIIDVYTMIEIVNDALQGLGSIQLTDVTITTSSDVTEYSLPSYLKYHVTNVQIQTDVTSNDWVDLSNYYVVNSGPGSTGLLCFTSEIPSGRTLKIFYESEHPEVNAFSDKISETLHSEFVTKLVVDKALEYQIRRTNGTDPFLMQTSNKAMQDANEARVRFSHAKRRKPKYLTPYDWRTEDVD
jgi:hypothetical protein